LFCTGGLVEFSEGVDCFPIDFFVDVFLEVLFFLWDELGADPTEFFSQNVFTLFFLVVAFLAWHVFIRRGDFIKCVVFLFVWERRKVFWRLWG